MCDEGRYSYKAANDPGLLAAMYVRHNNDLKPTATDLALKAVDRGLQEIVEAGGAIAGVLSPFLTVEEAYLLCRYLISRSEKAVLALGPVPVRGTDLTFQPDQTKGRTGDTSFVVPRPFTIHAEKCPNRRGVSALIEHFGGKVLDFPAFQGRAAAGEFQGLFLTGGSIDPWIDEQGSQALRSKVKFLVIADTLVTPLAHLADVVLAGATFAEKAGSYVNSTGRLQYSEAALPPRDGSLPDLDLLAILLHRPGGPVRSTEVLAEVAAAVPAFAAARGGKLPRHGVVLNEAPGATALPGAPADFTDAWFVAHGAARWR
jgi:NADH-quinone oxidoreductase subunit G